MRLEIKNFERGETGEDTRREGGEMIGMKIRGIRKWNKETRELIEEIIQDLSRK